MPASPTPTSPAAASSAEGPPGSGGAAPRLRYAGLDVALLGICGVAWGVAYVFIREGIVLGASPLLFAAVRYAFSAAAFFVIAGVRREAGPTVRNLAVSAAVGGVLVIGVYGGLLYSG